MTGWSTFQLSRNLHVVNFYVIKHIPTLVQSAAPSVHQEHHHNGM